MNHNDRYPNHVNAFFFQKALHGMADKKHTCEAGHFLPSTSVCHQCNIAFTVDTHSYEDGVYVQYKCRHCLKCLQVGHHLSCKIWSCEEAWVGWCSQEHKEFVNTNNFPRSYAIWYLIIHAVLASWLRHLICFFWQFEDYQPINQIV